MSAKTDINSDYRVHINDDGMTEVKPKKRVILSQIFKKHRGNIAIGAGSAAIMYGARTAGLATGSSLAVGAITAATAGGLTFGKEYWAYKKRVASRHNDLPGALREEFNVKAALKKAGISMAISVVSSTIGVGLHETTPDEALEKIRNFFAPVTNAVKSFTAGFSLPKLPKLSLPQIFKPEPTEPNTIDAPLPTEEATPDQKPSAPLIPEEDVKTAIASVELVQPIEQNIIKTEDLAIPSEEVVIDPSSLPIGEQAELLLSGVDTEHLPQTDIDAAKGGKLWGIQNVAHYLANPLEGGTQDLQKASEFAQIAARQDHATSIEFLADLEKVGVDAPEEFRSTIDSFNTAEAEKTSAEATRLAEENKPDCTLSITQNENSVTDTIRCNYKFTVVASGESFTIAHNDEIIEVENPHHRAQTVQNLVDEARVVLESKNIIPPASTNQILNTASTSHQYAMP